MGDDNANNPFQDIRKLVRSSEDGGKWKAYAADGTFLLDLEDDGLRHLALASEAKIKVEIEGELPTTEAVFLREGTVLVLRGFEIYDLDGYIEIQPQDHHILEVDQQGIRPKHGQSLVLEVGSMGSLDFSGVSFNRVLLDELMELTTKVKKLEERLKALEGADS